MSESRVVVVGTTSDYIGLILQRFPGRAVFLTGRTERDRASEPAPAPADEVLCDLTDAAGALRALRQHLEQHRIDPSGVACFDCESMSLASAVARELSLPYPSAEAITACRSKALSKELWRQHGLPCPEFALVDSHAAAVRFIERTGRPAVLKPLTGSGSELLFICSDAEECSSAFQTMTARLATHADVRMYAPYSRGQTKIDPRRIFAIEEFVEGPEYSCDFVVDDDRAEILRLAAKVPAGGGLTGVTLAYVVPGTLPSGMDAAALPVQLRDAARALGIERAICMIDLIVADGRAMMLELAPRPGGDCLPPLLLQSGGFDVLGAALDFAEGRPVTASPPGRWRTLVGLRLFADRPGVIRRLDDARIRRDSRVLESYLKRGPGHRVVLPPDDYDSRVLGHVIFRPSDLASIRDECCELAAKLELDTDE